MIDFIMDKIIFPVVVILLIILVCVFLDIYYKEYYQYENKQYKCIEFKEDKGFGFLDGKIIPFAKSECVKYEKIAQNFKGE